MQHCHTEHHKHRTTGAAGKYICPMCPSVEQDTPGSCPKCGMALEPAVPQQAKSKTQYTCPMHPEIIRDEPGDCPICGMALEPLVSEAEEENVELKDMTRRFWVSFVLALPVFVMAMAADLAPDFTHRFINVRPLQVIEFLLATPVVIWGGWPFFQRGWSSIRNRSLNMFTLISLGVGVAWVYSTVAMLIPGIFPDTVRMEGGAVAVYFEASAVITVLVLLGQVMELRARDRTNAAIKMLLGLAPKPPASFVMMVMKKISRLNR